MSVSVVRCAGLAFSALILAAPSLVESAPLKMVMLSKGQSPRARLRIRPPVGLTQTVVITTSQKMSMNMGGMALPQRDLPPTKVTIALKVLSVENGRIRASFDTVDVGVEETAGLPPGMAASLRASIMPLKNLKGVIELNDRGQVLSSDMPLQAIPNDQQAILKDFNQNLTRLVVPLPEEPVGIGASWKVIDTPQKMGVPITQEVVFTLTQRSGENIELSTEAIMTVAGGDISMPNMPPGIKTKTKPTKSTGRGQAQVDLTKLSGQGKVDMNVDFAMVMDQGGQSETMSMGLQMKMRIDSK